MVVAAFLHRLSPKAFCGGSGALGKALVVTFLSHKFSDANCCAETVREGATGLVRTCSFLRDSRTPPPRPKGFKTFAVLETSALVAP